VGSYDLAAFLIVLAMPVGAIAIAVGGFVWAQDALRRSLVPGAIGVLATLVAAGNVFVERRCVGAVNRPIVTAFVGAGDCQRSALAAVELVALLAVGTALAVRVREIRR
jgi:hypothetical protein